MELNREQIVKALECCNKGRDDSGNPPCEGCPYDWCNIVGGTDIRQTTYSCMRWLMIDALALIRELTEENERLRDESVDYREIPYIKADVRADTVRKMQIKFQMYF